MMNFEKTSMMAISVWQVFVNRFKMKPTIAGLLCNGDKQTTL